MPNIRKPRKGSMQFWPRKKSKKQTARVRSWAKVKEAKALGFAGYKAGMSHAIAVDNRQKSLTKGEKISLPVTIIECPAIKVAAIKFYKKSNYGLKAISEIFAEKLDKELGRKIAMPKKIKNKIEDVSETQGVSEHAQKSSISDIKDYDEIRLLAYTQPKLTGIGKKKPELFEIGVGGNKEEQLNYAKEKLGNEIKIEDIFKEGEQVDIHAITKGKGNQGPVKRFGIGLTSHKSEKIRRGPGSLGPWKAQGHVMYRIAYSGQTGYHLRTEYNKQILKISNKIEEIKARGGFLHYGFVKTPYVLLKGSIAGPAKRLIRMNIATRPSKYITKEAPEIKHIRL